jgi:glycogen debranching enzyme
MDARVGDRVVTPRIGKPVEVQALWINALWIAGRMFPRWAGAHQKSLKAFRERFWNEARGCLYDVVDVDHQRDAVDGTLRPNQILAVAGLPLALLEGERARQVVEVVERELWTPLGLRSLAAGEPGYVGHYRGDVGSRDGAYHQGTVWPWLAGPFAEAWIRVRGGSEAAKREARQRFVEPLIAHLDFVGLEHVSEIADGDPPHRPDGCPFQAWSVGELLRLEAGVLAEAARPAGARAAVPEHDRELVSAHTDSG